MPFVYLCNGNIGNEVINCIEVLCNLQRKYVCIFYSYYTFFKFIFCLSNVITFYTEMVDIPVLRSSLRYLAAAAR